MSSTAASKHFDEITLAITKIESQEPSIVVQGLNILTKKSFDALEANNVQFEHFPQLVVSLGSLLDVVNPLKDVIYGCSLASESSGLEYQNSWGRWRHSGNPTIKVGIFTNDIEPTVCFTTNFYYYVILHTGIILQLGRQCTLAHRS